MAGGSGEPVGFLPAPSAPPGSGDGAGRKARKGLFQRAVHKMQKRALGQKGPGGPLPPGGAPEAGPAPPAPGPADTEDSYTQTGEEAAAGLPPGFEDTAFAPRSPLPAGGGLANGGPGLFAADRGGSPLDGSVVASASPGNLSPTNPFAATPAAASHPPSPTRLGPGFGGGGGAAAAAWPQGPEAAGIASEAIGMWQTFKFADASKVSPGASRINYHWVKKQRKIVQKAHGGELMNIMRDMETMVLSGAFAGWIQVMQFRNTKVLAAQAMCSAVLRKKCRAAVLNWRTLARLQGILSFQLRRHESKRDARTARKLLRAWSAYAGELQSKRHRIIGDSFHAWMAWRNQKEHHRHRLGRAVTKWSQDLKANAVVTWHGHTRKKKVEVRLIHRQRRRREQQLLGVASGWWAAYAARKASLRRL